jgi:hypothetical protein
LGGIDSVGHVAQERTRKERTEGRKGKAGSAKVNRKNWYNRVKVWINERKKGKGGNLAEKILCVFPAGYGKGTSAKLGR